MSNVEIHHASRAPSSRGRDETAKEVAAGGSFTEALAGVGALVLGILGLLGVVPMLFAEVGVIVAGAGLLLESASIAARASRLKPAALASVPAETSGGLGSELIAAIGAIALGIIALAGVAPAVLTEIAVIAIGAGMLFASAAVSRMNAYPTDVRSDTAEDIVRGSIYTASGAHAVVGVGGVVLGILALIGIAPLTLTLVGVLAFGGSLAFGGGAIGGRIVAALQH